MTPLVSIIIPTYNRAHLIKETLDSVVAQSYQNWECILVDDGSSDATEHVIDEYVNKDSRFLFYKRPKNKPKGANACRNFGFDNSSGQYLIFLDSDDLLENTCVEHRLKTIFQKKTEGSHEVFVFNMGLFIKNKKSSRVFNKDSGGNTTYLNQFLKGIVPWTITCVFWKRNIFEFVGKFDESFQRLQDVDLHTRLLLNEVKIHRVNHVDCWYRILDDVTAYVTDDKLPRIINSQIKYISKFYNYSLKNDSLMFTTNMNACLKTNYINVFKKYVFKNKLIGFKQMMLLNKHHKILNTKQRVNLKLLAVYHIFKLNTTKGLGYNKLREQFFMQSDV
jgi:glycosyltransferase involved in cell wall biosynthesis